MSDSQVAVSLPRSHSPVLRWIRNPLSIGRGGSNPSLGANSENTDDIEIRDVCFVVTCPNTKSLEVKS